MAQRYEVLMSRAPNIKSYITNRKHSHGRGSKDKVESEVRVRTLPYLAIGQAELM